MGKRVMHGLACVCKEMIYSPVKHIHTRLLSRTSAHTTEQLIINTHTTFVYK